MGVEVPDVEEFRGLHLSNLGIDEAYVNITHGTTLKDDQPYYLYLRTDNCYKCPFRPYTDFFPEHTVKKSVGIT